MSCLLFRACRTCLLAKQEFPLGHRAANPVEEFAWLSRPLVTRLPQPGIRYAPHLPSSPASRWRSNPRQGTFALWKSAVLDATGPLQVAEKMWLPLLLLRWPLASSLPKPRGGPVSLLQGKDR